MAAGDIAIYREAAGLETIGTTQTNQTWDTNVRQDAIYTRTGTNVDLGESGHYLVITNLGLQSASGSNRSEIQSRLNLNGVNLAYGRSTGYIRRSGGTDECFLSSATIINATAGNDLIVNAIRTDSNSATVQRRANECGLQLLKLNDNWDYLRIRNSANQSVATTYTDVTWNVQDEVDSGSFTQSSGNITLNQTGHYMVCSNVMFDTGSSGTRVGAKIRLTLDGTQVNGSEVTAYMRGNNGCNTGCANLFIIIEATAGQILRLQAIRDTFATANILSDSTGFTAVKLNDFAEFVRLRETGGGQRIDTNADITWDTNVEVDSASFTHSTVTNTENIQVNKTGDYLFLSTFYSDRTGTSGSRLVPHWVWEVNGTSQQYGSFGFYNRGTQGGAPVLYAGRSGGFIANLTDTDDISITNIDESTGTDVNATFQPNDYVIQGINLASLFDDNSSSTTSSTSSDSSASSSSDSSFSSSTSSISTSSSSDIESQSTNSTSSAGYPDWDTFTCDQWFKFTCEEWEAFSLLEDSSSSESSGGGTCDLMARRFTNSVNNGLVADEVFEIFGGGIIPDIYNPNFYGIRVPRLKVDCSRVFKKTEEDPEEDDPEEITILHRYILDRTSFPASEQSQITNGPDRLLILDESETSNVEVLDRRFGDAAQTLDDAIDGQIANTLSTSFNGADEYINFGNSLPLTSSTPFTVAFYLNVQTLPTLNSGILVKKNDNGGAATGYAILIEDSSEALEVRFANGTTEVIASGPVISEDTWYHFVITYNGDGDISNIEIWSDGVQFSATYTGTTIGSITNSSDLVMGAFSNNIRHSDCYISEMMIWNRVITNQEISDLYNSGNLIDPSEHSTLNDIFTWWRMGEGDSATTVFDAVGSVNGTLVNMDATNYITNVP